MAPSPMASSSRPDSTNEAGLLDDITGKDQRLQRFKRWLDQSEKANDQHIQNIIKARRYVSGDLCTAAARERRGKARPTLTVNKILPRVLFLEGMQRSQRQEPDFLPFEGGDARGAEIMGALYKWYGTKCREPVVDSKVFDRKIVGGLGYWKVSWRFEDDLEGNLLWESPDPLTIFPDPNWLDSGWEHCQYVEHATWQTLEDAIDLWPDHEDELRTQYGEWLNETITVGGQFAGRGDFAGDTFSDERSYWDPETQRMRVVECWYKRRVPVHVVMRNETGETASDPEKVKQIQMAVRAMPHLAEAFTFLKVPVTKINVAHFTSQTLLDDEASPYEEQCLPIFPTLGYYWWRIPFGLVDPLIDLQDEKNVRRSSIAEMVQRSALAGWFNKQDSGANSEDLEKYAAGISKVIPFKQDRPEVIEPPQLPQAVVYLESAADRDFDSVSNINAELLGLSSQRTVSGRALGLRQQAGLVVQEPLLESFRQDKEPAVRFALTLIKQFTAKPKAARILGTIAVREPQGQLAQTLGQIQGPDALDQVLGGAFDECYDVTIGAKPFDPSLMRQRSDALMEIAKEFPQYTPPEALIAAAKDAGIITEDVAAQFLQFAQQRQALDQAQQQAATAGQAPAPPNRAP